MIKVKAKQTNETKIKGYSYSIDFISKIKGLCFPLCFPLCFQRNRGIGKVKQDNDDKFKVKQNNE